MKIVFFVHSLISDWNHGNAHFLRGVASELVARGHDVVAYEPRDSWSLQNLVRTQGPHVIAEFRQRFPDLRSIRFDGTFDLSDAVSEADLVIVHEWNDPDVVAELGRIRIGADFKLLFHDTHHRAATAPEEMSRYDLRGYDGVLAFGNTVRDIYVRRGWASRAWTWHEAADTRVFYPREASAERDVVWIGNWGDNERKQEIEEFLLRPVEGISATGSAYGVRCPPEVEQHLARAGLSYEGSISNHEVPDVLARHRVTVHVPRRPYAQKLPGIPTIRVFEALACAIPLVCAPWSDEERLFRPGDFLMATDAEEMASHLKTMIVDRDAAAEVAEQGRQTILERHTCSHRVDELMKIYEELA